ncbi:MAG: efflux RND transporter permease subunit, partial [Planctomycetes bacterium]|nr:efflux RND transporter permease subunit [Planctomycetota bacterium]
ESDEEVRVRVLLPEESRRTVGDLARLRIVTPSGRRVPLEEVAELRTARGYSTLARVDGKRVFTVTAEVDQSRANVREITDAINAEIDQDFAAAHPGVSVTFEGRKKELNDSLGSLLVGFPVALFLIYSIIAILFRSYFQPLVVMAAIPYSILGAIVGHLITGYPFTLLSLIGGVALAGIVVNDSLILVDFVNRLRREGKSVQEALVEGGKGRLRPIILTSITTISGLAPLMLERSFQAQFLIPMAVSIVYGLAFATVLTLYLLPVLYLILEDIVRLIRGKKPVC